MALGRDLDYDNPLACLTMTLHRQGSVVQGEYVRPPVNVDRDGAVPWSCWSGATRGAVSGADGELPRLQATEEAWDLPCIPLRRGYFETSLCCCDLDGDGLLARVPQPGATAAAQPRRLPAAPPAAGCDPAQLEAGPLLRYREAAWSAAVAPRPVGPHRLLSGRLGTWTAPAIWWPAPSGTTPASSTATFRLCNPVLAAQHRHRRRADRAPPAHHRGRRNADHLCHHKCAVWCHDLDGDGAPDLICGSEDGKTYAWLRSTCAGTGIPPPASPPNRSPPPPATAS